MRRLRTCAVAVVAAAGLIAAGSSPAFASHRAASAHHFGHDTVWHPSKHSTKHSGHRSPTAGTPTVVASGLVGPLTFDVSGRSIYVGQFTGTVSKLTRGADPVVVGTAAPGAGADAVDVAPGVLTWGERSGDQSPAVTASILHRQTRNGSASFDMLAYEKTANPDKNVEYGFRGLSAACLAQVPDMFKPYTGTVDSHVYGSVNTRGVTYVADAGANAILKVDRKGRISTVAVLAPVPVTVTAAAAGGLGLPGCVVGKKYYFEAVPTDVEVGRGGALYVTLLPGGPEDGSLGEQGRLVKVNPRTGKVATIATGFGGATGLAVSPHGTIFVAELYSNEVSSVSRHGKVRTLVSLNQPAGIEWAHGKLYVSTDVFGAGKIVAMKVK